MTRIRSLRAVMPACLGFMACAPAASAATFTVDSAQTGADVAINGTCDSDATADVDCTLRAAVEEANATAAADTILFNKSSVSGGDPDDSNFISGTSSLISAAPPAITQPLTLNAGDCSATGADPPSPCANVVAGWVVDSPAEVSIGGLAVSGNGAAIGIRVIEAGNSVPAVPDFLLTNTWFGIDGEADKAGEIGDSVGGAPAALRLEDVTGARIGTGFVDDRDVFARQSVGVDIQGADDTQVAGNLFGVMPDGSFARAGEFDVANDDAIEVTGDSAPNPDDEATGTVIGAADDTPACDGACNVIAGAGTSDDNPDFRAGVDLNGEAGDGEIPASGARIVGNDIGDDIVNTVAVNVGNADGIEIGGSAAGEGNAIGINEVRSEAGATDLLVQGNVVDADPLVPALFLRGSGEVLGNRINGNSAFGAIRLQNTTAPNFTVQGNVIGENPDGSAAPTGSVGIELLDTASGNTIGGPAPGDGNLISDLVLNQLGVNSVAIRVAGDDNEVLGNRIGIGSDGSARPFLIGVHLIDGATGNAIGGTTPAGENLIANGGGSAVTAPGTAIRIEGAGSDGNEVLRNRGFANVGPFIDLGGDGVGNLPEPNGPNAGAQAPSVTAATSASASGTAAPGSLVRLFLKSGAAPGEIDAFITEVVANGSGAWQATFPALPTAGLIAATATTAGGTSELSTAVPFTIDPVDPDPPTADSDPPETRIDGAPKNKLKVKRRGKVTYEFSSDEPGSTFRCSLDGRSAAACTSPLKLKGLRKGTHTFSVVATDGAGNADGSAATDSFKVKRKKRRR